MSDPTSRCVIGTREHGAHVGHLCRAHYDRAHQWLIDVEVEAALLSPMKSMSVGQGNRGAAPAFTRSPARLDAIVLRDARRGTGIPMSGEPDPVGWDETPSILDVLHSWARLVREERDLTPPVQVTIVGERGLLSAHLDWIAEQPWVDEFIGELHTLRATIKATNGTQDDKPYGRCYLPSDYGTCDGPIWLDWAMGRAHCGRCRETWNGEQLAMLKAELDHAREEAARPRTSDGRRMLTAEEMAKRLRIDVTAFRMRASRAKVRAVRGHYDPDQFRVKASA